MRSVALALLLTTPSCARPTATAPDAAAPAPVEDCALSTPLVPGVPGSPGHLLPSALNPNGASELATLMRRMQDDLKAARALLLDGGAPAPMFARHRKMRCAWPTAAADRNEKFDALALVYLATVRSLDERRLVPAAAFDNVVSACHACHDMSCPGPLVVIDALRIDAGVKLVSQ